MANVVLASLGLSQKTTAGKYADACGLPLHEFAKLRSQAALVIPSLRIMAPQSVGDPVEIFRLNLSGLFASPCPCGV